MTPQEALARVIEHREIFHEEMLDVMRQVMSGEDRCHHRRFAGKKGNHRRNCSGGAGHA